MPPERPTNPTLDWLTRRVRYWIGAGDDYVPTTPAIDPGRVLLVCDVSRDPGDTGGGGGGDVQPSGVPLRPVSFGAEIPSSQLTRTNGRLGFFASMSAIGGEEEREPMVITGISLGFDWDTSTTTQRLVSLSLHILQEYDGFTPNGVKAYELDDHPVGEFDLSDSGLTYSDGVPLQTPIRETSYSDDTANAGPLAGFIFDPDNNGANLNFSGEFLGASGGTPGADARVSFRAWGLELHGTPYALPAQKGNHARSPESRT